MKTTLLTLALLLTLSTASYAETTHPALKRFDKDGDNQISKAEAPFKMKQRFAKHDLDGDGFISGDEFNTLPKHPKKRRQNRQGNKPPRTVQ